MSRRGTTDFDPECLECPLPDCFPSDPRCPVLRKKAAEKGLTLPDAPLEIRTPDIVPKQYLDRADYHRQYNRVYNARRKRIAFRGIRIRKEDIEILRGICAKEGRSLEREITTLLELMAEKARAQIKG